MGIQFCRLQFAVQNRSLLDPEGRPLLYPLVYGSKLTHWADPVRAMGWFKQAQKILADTQRLAVLDSPVILSDQAANQRQATAQFVYMAEVMTAIAHGLNLLNLVWHNDPELRQIYRNYIAGPPALDNIGTTDSPDAALFEERLDYNPRWYSRDEMLPKAWRHPNQYGGLQDQALAQTKGTPGLPFAISATLTLAPARPLQPGQTIDAVPAVFNVPIVRMKTRQLCGIGQASTQSGNVSDFGMAIGSGFTNTATPVLSGSLGMPWQNQCNWTQGLAGAAAGTSNFRMPAAIMPNDTMLPAGFDDWRAAYLGEMLSGMAAVAGALRDSVPMLRAFVRSLLSRSPEQIIQDNRAFTAYQNAETIRLNGASIDQAWAAIAGSEADIQAQRRRPGTDGTIAASILGTTAAIVAPAVPVAGLILGAAAGVVTLLNTLLVHGTQGHGRDDLGRYKLQMERAWLSGDPQELSLQTGPPTLPLTELADPPGAGVSWVPNTNCSTGSSRAFWWLAGTLAVASGAAYVITKGKI